VALADSTVVFLPDLNEFGSPYTSFNFSVDDGNLVSPPAEVLVNVDPVNDIPVALAESVTQFEDVPVVIVLNGTDVESTPDSLTMTITTMQSVGMGLTPKFPCFVLRFECSCTVYYLIPFSFISLPVPCPQVFSSSMMTRLLTTLACLSQPWGQL
jgi:cadherin-like protein